MGAEPFDPMKMADQFGDFVATMTGLKAQLIAAGWSEPNAEALAVEALRHG